MSTADHRRRNLAVVAVLLVLAVVVFFALYSTMNAETYDYIIEVSYQGSWSASYQGYRGGPPATVPSHGTFAGTGDDSSVALVQGTVQDGSYVCAWATQLDASEGTLALSVCAPPGGTAPAWSNETSTPNRTRMVCGGVVP